MTCVQHILRGLAICCVAGAASSTSAAPLPDFAFFGGANVFIDPNSNGSLTTFSQNDNLLGAATVTVPGTPGGETIAQTLGGTAPLPSVTASVSNSVGGTTVFGSSARNELDYWIRVVGPAALNVPLVVNGNGSLFSTPTASAASQLFLSVNFNLLADVSTSNGVATQLGGSVNLAGFNPAAFAINQTLSVGANLDIFVELLVIATIQGPFIQSASAFVDPIFFIDPNFAGAANYSIETSFGIGNGPVATSETPLPAALPLFASGLGALGLLGWRRKKKVAAFAA